MTNIETFKYDNRIVRAFAIATVIWGLVGFSTGLLIFLLLPSTRKRLEAWNAEDSLSIRSGSEVQGAAQPASLQDVVFAILHGLPEEQPAHENPRQGNAAREARGAAKCCACRGA